VTAGVLRVLIADDHPAIREGVRAALDRGGLAVCAAVSDADTAIAQAIELRPDVCLLDIAMPGNGLRAVAEISAKVPETVILMLTVSEKSEDLFEALRSGAGGYLLKSIDPVRLPVVINAALNGEVIIPRDLTARLVERIHDPGGRAPLQSADGRTVELTPREWDVLELFADGLDTNEVAGRLFVRNITVRRHISDVMRKLRVHTREDAIRLYKRRGETPPRSVN
jgi:DNA-binding NarL/FixJ family response regulator